VKPGTPRGTAVAVIVVLATVLVVAILEDSYSPRTGPSGGSSGNPPGSNPQCKGTAACFTDTVTYIVDGDTLDVGSTRIRLALVNSPEVGEPGYAEAKQFTAQTCPVGSQALVDCGGVNLNAALLSSGHAVLVTYYCSVSEFADEPWTGCP